MWVIRRIKYYIIESIRNDADEYGWVYIMEDVTTDLGYTWTSNSGHATEYDSVEHADSAIREHMMDHAYTSASLDVIPVCTIGKSGHKPY